MYLASAGQRFTDSTLIWIHLKVLPEKLGAVCVLCSPTCFCSCTVTSLLCPTRLIFWKRCPQLRRSWVSWAARRTNQSAWVFSALPLRQPSSSQSPLDSRHRHWQLIENDGSNSRIKTAMLTHSRLTWRLCSCCIGQTLFAFVKIYVFVWTQIKICV